MSDIFSIQTRLITEISAALPKLKVTDNVLPPLPSAFPFVAVDPVSADPLLYAGGTQDLQRFTFDIYIVVALASHHGILREARAALSALTNSVLAIPRLYASSVVFGEDVIGSSRVSICQIKATFPV